MIKTLLIGLVKAYHLLLRPWLGSSCRFVPTCSAYSLQALQMHGAAAVSNWRWREWRGVPPGAGGVLKLFPLKSPRPFPR